MDVSRSLTAFAVAGLMSGCAANTPLHPLNAPWATYQHSPDRNAVFGGPTIAHDWSHKSNAKINSGLTLVGNALLFTTFSHQLVALDVRTGRELWHASVPNIAMSTPIVAGNTVYIGTGSDAILGRSLYVKLRFPWKAVMGIPPGDQIAAFDLHSGAWRWSYRTVGEDMPSPVYAGGRLFFANGDRHAYALRADTGQLLWSTDVGGISTMASAVMAGNAVVVGVCTRGMRDSSVVALDSSSGNILWRSPYGHCDAAPAYADGKVFVSSVSLGDTALQGRPVIAAIDAKTGKPVWVYRDSAQGVWSFIGSSEAAVAGTYANGVYYQSTPFTDEILALDAKTGRLRWHFHTAGPAKMSPVVKTGRLYIGDIAGLLYTLDADDGSLLEIRAFKQAFTVSPPIIAGNRLIIVNGTSIHAIPLSGRPKLAESVGWAIASDITSPKHSCQ